MDLCWGLTYIRGGRQPTFFGRCQKMMDVVFYYENLMYSKVYGTIFRQILAKLNIPQGVVDFD